MATQKKESNVDVSKDPLEIVGQLIKFSMKNLSPYQKGVNKKLEETGYQQTEEAVAAGVPREHIEDQANLNPNKILEKLVSSPESSPTETTNPKMLPPKGTFSGASMDAQGNVNNEGWGNQLLRGLIGISGPSANQVIERQSSLNKLSGVDPESKSKLAYAEYMKSGGSKSRTQARIEFSQQMAEPIVEAVKRGDYSGYINADKMTKTVVSSELADQGIDVDAGVLGFGAEQKAMGNVKIMEAKVTSGQAAQTLLDAAYDPKTKTYKLPPAGHTELAISVARLLSPTGVIAQQMVDELTQRTAREGLAGVGIWLGLDPKELGGSTQSVIKYFANVIKRESELSQKNRDRYLKGKTADYMGMEKSGSGEAGQQTGGGKTITLPSGKTITIGQ